MHYPFQVLLLADIFDIITSVIALMVPVLWVMKQIFDATKQEAPPRGGPPEEAPPPQPQVEAQAAGQQADPLRNQVEEFLRRAGRGPQQPAEPGRPAPPQRRVRPAGPREIEVLVDENAPQPPERRPLAEPLRSAGQPAAPARPQPVAMPRQSRPQRRAAAAPQRETVAEHVADSLAAQSQNMIDRTSRLGQQIIEDDHQFDVQLKAKFDHTVGSLTGSAVTAAERADAAARATKTPAAEIVAMLSNPDGARQAIVINEILRRPSELW